MTQVLEKSTITSNSKENLDQVKNIPLKLISGLFSKLDQQSSNGASSILDGLEENNCHDYSKKHFAFRDIDKITNIFLDPQTSKLDRIYLKFAIVNYSTKETIHKLEQASRNLNLDNNIRAETFDLLLTAITTCPDYKKDMSTKLLSLIKDDSLPLNYRVQATQALFRSGTRESLKISKEITADTSLRPEIRITACLALNYEAKETLKSFIFDTKNSDNIRILALNYFSILHDEDSLPAILKIAQGQNKESDKLRIATVKAGLFSKSEEFLKINHEFIKNGPDDLRVDAIKALRASFPKDMIRYAKEALIDPNIENASKFKICSALGEYGDTKVEDSATNFLAKHLGEEAVEQFIKELPESIQFYFASTDFESTNFQNQTQQPTTQEVQFARFFLEQKLKSSEKISPTLDVQDKINTLIKSKQTEDIALLKKLIENKNCPDALKVIITGKLEVGDSQFIENMMLNATLSSDAVNFASILFKIDQIKGTAALRELLNNPTSDRQVIELCSKKRDPNLIDMLTKKYLETDFNNQNNRQFLIKLGNELENPKFKQEFIASIIRVANFEKDFKKAKELKEWAVALGKSEKYGIEHPLRLKPETLCEIIKNRELSPESLKKDKREVVIICMPKADHNGFAYGMRNEIDNLRSKGYRLMFYEVSSRDSLIEATKSASQSSKAKNLIIIGHGTRDSISFSGKDPGQGSDINSSNGLCLKDAEALKQNSFGECLKKNGRILLISCSVGSGSKNADNIANMIREVVPHATYKGIIAPTVPTTFQNFIFDNKNNLIDFNGSADRYQAFRSKKIIENDFANKQKIAA